MWPYPSWKNLPSCSGLETRSPAERLGSSCHLVGSCFMHKWSVKTCLHGFQSFTPKVRLGAGPQSWKVSYLSTRLPLGGHWWKGHAHGEGLWTGMPWADTRSLAGHRFGGTPESRIHFFDRTRFGNKPSQSTPARCRLFKRDIFDPRGWGVFFSPAVNADQFE